MTQIEELTPEHRDRKWIDRDGWTWRWTELPRSELKGKWRGDDPDRRGCMTMPMGEEPCRGPFTEAPPDPSIPRFSFTQFRCDDCGAQFFLQRGEDHNIQMQEHVQQHLGGRCEKCGHWNDQHRDKKFFPEPVEGWVNGPLICGAPTGQGDFCGCGVERV